MYLTETHCHTALVSPCSVISPEKLVEVYHSAGYSTIVVTDHFRKDTVEGGMEGSTAAQRMERYLSGWQRTKQAGQQVGLQVLFGIELAFAGKPEDFLLYGVTVPFLEKYPDLFDRTLEEVYALAEHNGILVYQAHPFRSYLTAQSPAVLHGVEVYNGHNHHDSHNEDALAFAKTNDLMMISGTDCHDTDCVGRGGIATERPIVTLPDLMAALRSPKTRLIRDGKIC